MVGLLEQFLVEGGIVLLLYVLVKRWSGRRDQKIRRPAAKKAAPRRSIPVLRRKGGKADVIDFGEYKKRRKAR